MEILKSVWCQTLEVAQPCKCQGLCEHAWQLAPWLNYKAIQTKIILSLALFPGTDGVVIPTQTEPQLQPEAEP